MSDFSDVFGGQTVPPSEYSLTRIDLTNDGSLAWPNNFSGELPNEYVASSIVEVSLSSVRSLRLPPANQTSVGTDLVIINVGSDTLSILDVDGGPVTNVLPSESKYFYVQANLTAGGAWGVFTYGTGTSGADAMALAGSGLQPDFSNRLRTFVDYRSIGGNSDVELEDRNKILEVVVGAITLTMPPVLSAGLGFVILVRNSSDGNAVIEGSGSETIDGSLNKNLFPGESCFLICNGTYWMSVGYGRDSEFAFTEVLVDASLGSTTLTSSDVAGRMIRVAGAATSNIEITLPNVDNIYFATVESSVGAFNVTFKTSLPGSEVLMLADQSTILYSDGTNVLTAINTALLSVVLLADGSALSPSARFTLDTDTGLFRSGSGHVSFSSNGVAVAGFNSSGLMSLTPATADSTTKAATTAFVQANFAARSVVAGDGLTGGGNLSTSRTVDLGLPSTITGSTSNSVSADSHTHALTVTSSDVGLGNVTNDAQLKIASDLADLNNASDARNNLGLGTAAVEDVTTSSVDTTVGRLLKVGDFGLGSSNLPLVLDLDNHLLVPGLYRYDSGSGSTNGPEGTGNALIVHDVLAATSAAGWATQLFFATSGVTYVRRNTAAGSASWSAWNSYQTSDPSFNAATATALQTARDFTIGATARSFDGTADVSWTLADLGVYPAYATVTSTSKTVIPGELCAVTASGLTVTLPATPAPGDTVGVSIVGAFLDTVVARNGENIMGLAENMTIDRGNVTVTYTYVDATRGWRMV